MKLVGMMVVGPGEADRWLEQALEQRKMLVDDMIIVGNNTDEKTEKLIKKYGWWFYRDDREWGKFQPRIKDDLLAKIAKLKPDWVLGSDADEIYDSAFTRDEAEELMSHNYAAYYFAIFNLWNDEEYYRHDLSFWNIRMFQFLPQYGLTFTRKNVHCGLAPPFAYKYGANAPFILKHYGLMYEEDRKKKILRYEKYDPRAKFKGKEFYDKLKNEKQIAPFNEEAIHKKIAAEVSIQDQRKKLIHG